MTKLLATLIAAAFFGFDEFDRHCPAPADDAPAEAKKRIRPNPPRPEIHQGQKAKKSAR